MKKRITIYAILTISFMVLLNYGCERTDIKPTVKPIMKTDTITDITHTSAVIKSEIDSFTIDNINELGVCWSPEHTPTLADNKILESTDSLDNDYLMCTLDGLSPDTYYYVRAFVIYNTDTIYGNSLSFKTWKPFPVNGTLVYDIDGNTYHTVIIGNQVWLTENLKTTKFSNGDTIAHYTDTTIWAWHDVNYSAYSDYNNNTSLSKTYGRLYNWLAVDDSRGLCPKGWHVPTEEELAELINYLGGDSIAGEKLKESGTSHWKSPNTYATNASGFTALPTGYKEIDGTFQAMGYVTYLWSSTEIFAPYAACLPLGYSDGGTTVYSMDKKVGSPVRCIMDK